MVTRLVCLVLARPRLARIVLTQVLTYMQLRHLLDRGGFWQPNLARLDEPRFEHREPASGTDPGVQDLRVA